MALGVDASATIGSVVFALLFVCVCHKPGAIKNHHAPDWIPWFVAGIWGIT